MCLQSLSSEPVACTHHSRTNRQARVPHTNVTRPQRDCGGAATQPSRSLPTSPKIPYKLRFLSKRLGARAAVAFEQAEALLTLPCGTW